MQHTKERGQALVEFAIVIPVFMLILAGMIQFGIILWGQNTLNQVVRDTGRWAATQTACDSSTAALVRDTALTLDVRADAVMDYGDAFCVSPREILLGIGPRRLQAISRAATSLETQGYDGPWTVFARTHAAWLAGGGLSRTRIRADSSANAPFSVGEFLVRLPVLGRASHCRYFQLR